jgi:hypothetical protein
MTRTPEEIFSDHFEALSKKDVPLILQDFARDATVISPQGPLQGLAGVEAFYTQALAGLPDIDFTIVSKVFGADALQVRWTGRASAGRVDDGVDTFVFAEGKIALQSTWFTIVPTA